MVNIGQGQNSDNQLSNAISAQILPIEPQDQYQPIHRVPVYGSSTIVCKVLWVKLEQLLQVNVGVSEFWPYPRFGHLPYLTSLGCRYGKRPKLE